MKKDSAVVRGMQVQAIPHMCRPGVSSAVPCVSRSMGSHALSVAVGAFSAALGNTTTTESSISRDTS